MASTARAIDMDAGCLLLKDPRDPSNLKASELQRQAAEAVQSLLVFLLDQPTTPSPVGRVVQLPTTRTRFPRALPVPQTAPLTRWEQYKKKKGLPSNKKEKLVFDEQSQTFKKRWGYDRANDEMDKHNWVVEHKHDDFGAEDPFAKKKAAKKLRVQQNADSQARNEQNAQRLSAASGPRLPGTLDLVSAAKKGAKSARTGSKVSRRKEKGHLDVALELAQQSTASMGRFDTRAHKHEATQRKAVQNSGVRTGAKEQKQALSVLNRVVGRTAREGESFNLEKAANRAISVAEQSRSVQKKSEGPKGKKGGAASASGRKGKFRSRHSARPGGAGPSAKRRRVK